MRWGSSSESAESPDEAFANHHGADRRRYSGRRSCLRGYSSYKLVTREDANHELHVYRVPTDPYMQAIWRKGNLRVVVGSGGCDGLC